MDTTIDISSNTNLVHSGPSMDNNNDTHLEINIPENHNQHKHPKTLFLDLSYRELEEIPEWVFNHDKLHKLQLNIYFLFDDFETSFGFNLFLLLQYLDFSLDANDFSN